MIETRTLNQEFLNNIWINVANRLHDAILECGGHREEQWNSIRTSLFERQGNKSWIVIRFWALDISQMQI